MMKKLNLEIKDISNVSEITLFEEQLHIVQEELERIHMSLSLYEKSNSELQATLIHLQKENELLFNQLSYIQKKMIDKNVMAQIEGNVVVETFTPEAEKIKKHLSYRLGNILVTQGKSFIGWLKMPWLLFREVKRFKAEIEKRG